MGGAGNSGLEPSQQLAATGGGSAPLPTWGQPASPAGGAAPVTGVPTTPATPDPLRPYEQTPGSTGTGPTTGLLAGASTQQPQGFQHSPYGTIAATDNIPTIAGATPTAPTAPTAPTFTADDPNDWYYYGSGSQIAQGTPWKQQQARGAAGNPAPGTIGSWGRRAADGSITYMPDPWTTPS